jgi:cobalamin biosynthesis Mg chelatase CobN
MRGIGASASAPGVLVAVSTDCLFTISDPSTRMHVSSHKNYGNKKRSGPRLERLERSGPPRTAAKVYARPLTTPPTTPPSPSAGTSSSPSSSAATSTAAAGAAAATVGGAAATAEEVAATAAAAAMTDHGAPNFFSSPASFFSLLSHICPQSACSPFLSSG